MDTLRLPRLYRSFNWERLAQHSEPRHTNPCSSRALQALGSFSKKVKQLGIFSVLSSLSLFLPQKGVSSVSDALKPFLTPLISLFLLLRPYQAQTPLYFALKRYVDSVFPAFSFSNAFKAFPHLFPHMYACSTAIYMDLTLFFIGIFWHFYLWLLWVLFSHWQLGLLDIVDQGDAQ